MIKKDVVRMRVIPLTLKEANDAVEKWHRHHKRAQGHRFSLGLLGGEGELRGALIAGRPVARGCDWHTTLEVTRLVTDGAKNGCSMLYAAAANSAKAMGFDRIQTYVLLSEPGTSLKASGWVLDGLTAGGQWAHTDGKERRTDQPIEPKQRWVRVFR